METNERVLAEFDKWWASLKRYKKNHGFPARATIGGALVMVDRLQGDCNLDIKSHLTPGGGQIRAVSGNAVDRILSRYGEPTGFLVEVRTNRGLIGEIGSMLKSLQRAGTLKVAAEERRVALEACKILLIRQIREFRNKERIKIEFDATKSTWFAINQLLAKARASGKDGPVAQYLTGAKLQQRFPELVISNDGHSSADVQTGRPGDFLIGDTAIHVTVRPMDAVFQKCLRNIKDGFRPLMLVPAELSESTRIQAELHAPGQITVTSIESFVGQNVEELSKFSADQVRSELQELLRLYNVRVDEVELDKSVLLEIPHNLTPKKS